jgi:hypothetical protein
MVLLFLILNLDLYKKIVMKIEVVIEEKLRLYISFTGDFAANKCVSRLFLGS